MELIRLMAHCGVSTLYLYTYNYYDKNLYLGFFFFFTSGTIGTKDNLDAAVQYADDNKKMHNCKKELVAAVHHPNDERIFRKIENSV